MGGVMTRRAHLHIGVFSILFSAFLYLVGIPHGITSPSNVGNIVLSPLFWPQILAGILAVGGVALVVTSRQFEKGRDRGLLGGIEGGVLRLLSMGGLMVVYVLLTPWLGMVWTSMFAFAAVAFLIRTRHKRSAALASVLVPLLLYAFFAHVAGVAVPQGELVRLP